MMNSAYLQIPAQWAKYVTFMGKVLFFFFFWFTGGVYLGGEELFFGVFKSSLEILFPLSGIGIFLIFLTMFLEGRWKEIEWRQFFFLLTLLGLLMINVLWAYNSEVSILLFPMFIMGILSVVTVPRVSILDQSNKRWLFFGICFGVIVSFFTTVWVSESILSFAIILFCIQVMQDEEIKDQKKQSLWMFMILFLFLLKSLLGLGILFGLMLTKHLWLARAQKQQKNYLLPQLLVLVGIFVLGFFINWFSLPEQVQTLGWFVDMKTFFVGVGESNYLLGLQHHSDLLLRPRDLNLPNTGIYLWWIEYGMLGIVFLSGVLLWSLRWGRRNTVILLCSFVFFLFSAEIVIEESAFLFWLVCLLTPKYIRISS